MNLDNDNTLTGDIYHNGDQMLVNEQGADYWKENARSSLSSECRELRRFLGN